MERFNNIKQKTKGPKYLPIDKLDDWLYCFIKFRFLRLDNYVTVIHHRKSCMELSKNIFLGDEWS